MPIINHLNYADDDNRIYCRKLNKIAELNDEHVESNCMKCPMFAGSLQGQGVECSWNDTREKVQDPHIVTRPASERQELIIEDELNPSRKLVVTDKKNKK